MSLRVVVTSGDVAAGRVRDRAEYAVLLAIARCGRAAGLLAPPVGRGYVHVGGSCFRVGPHSGRLPDPVVAWMHRFDLGEPVEPIQFDLPMPERPARPPDDPRTRPRRPDGRFQAPG